MTSKLFVKKVIKRAPLQSSNVQNSQILPMTSKSSLYNAIQYKPIAVEEYNRVLIKNQRLAKENALLKNQFNRCKETLGNENIELKQQLINTMNENERLRTELKNINFPNISQVLDRIKHANNFLTNEYFRVNAIKEQLNEFGNKVETIRGIMSSMEALIDTRSLDQNEVVKEISGERLDSFWSLNETLIRRDSRRFSMSTQEQDVRRRLSHDKIKHDFQVMTDLSTILELSRENRISSIGMIGDITSGDIGIDYNNRRSSGIAFTATTSTATSAATSLPSVPAITNALNDKRVLPTALKEKVVKPKKVTKIKTTNSKKESVVQNKKKKKKEEEKGNRNESQNKGDISVYDFNDEDDDKENVVPSVTRKSKRIRSNANAKQNIYWC